MRLRFAQPFCIERSFRIPHPLERRSSARNYEVEYPLGGSGFLYSCLQWGQTTVYQPVRRSSFG
jgi:hypothetical protein